MSRIKTNRTILNKGEKDKTDKTGKDHKDKTDKPGKDGKSGGGHGGGSSLPSGIPTPQSGAASLLPAAGAIGGGIIGGILSSGKKYADKKEKKPAKGAAASSDTIKWETSVQVSTWVVAAGPLYSEGKGSKIAIMDFEGEYGAEFADLLAEALKTDLKVYSRNELTKKNYSAKDGGMSLAKKVASEISVDYVVTGKVSKKTETLSIISISLRSGKTGDIKMTDYPKLKSAEDLKTIAEAASVKMKERTKQ